MLDGVWSVKQLDKAAYRSYVQNVDREIDDRSSNKQKYVLSAYNYYRSRLLVPGRNYADEDHGPLAIGGSAHVDLIDLDIWLSKQNVRVKREARDWTLDASLEQTAYWRGLGPNSRSTIKRRRDKIAEDAHENATNGIEKS